MATMTQTTRIEENYTHPRHGGSSLVYFVTPAGRHVVRYYADPSDLPENQPTYYHATVEAARREWARLRGLVRAAGYVRA